MMDQDGRPQGSTPPHPHRPRFTGVGFLEAGCRGAAPDGVSGVSPDFLPPSAPEGGVPKKPTFVKVVREEQCSSVGLLNRLQAVLESACVGTLTCRLQQTQLTGTGNRFGAPLDLEFVKDF